MKIRKRDDNSFPNNVVIYRKLGKKPEMAAIIIEYCEREGGCEDVIDICRLLCKSVMVTEENDSKDTAEKFEFVYLMKSGKYYKIGRTTDVGRRRFDIGIKLPEDLDIIHQISTDDPIGIEYYWHRRFKDKRKKGEWFELTSADVKAFKRRKFQ